MITVSGQHGKGPNRLRAALALVGSSLAHVVFGSLQAFSIDEIPGLTRDSGAIREAGLVVWLDAGRRDQIVQQLADAIRVLSRSDRNRLEHLQGAFQEALLLAADREVYDTLATETIEAVDNALEAVFDLSDIHRSTDWEPLIYVYGYFNRDVRSEDIRRVADLWRAIPHSEREPLYPTYPHVIDAVCKPLSMGELAAGDTADALEAAIPALREQLLTPARPGRSFHSPSHASIVLAPMYDRWPEGSRERGIIERILGTREDFIRLLIGQIVGSIANPDTLPEYAYPFYAYSGRYIANALARLDARAAVGVLLRSVDVYEERARDPLAVAYTRRALVALGDNEAREELRVRIANDQTQKDAVRELVWLCRNCHGEGLDFAQTTLARQLGVAPEMALRAYFENELALLRDQGK